jgi:carboxyl-terminal processing protease
MRALAGRALLSILLCGWLCVAGGPGAGAEPRVALVVGNSDYGGDLGRLPNPVNDAKLMADTLRKVGFDVVEVEDADQATMKQAIVDFGDKLSEAGAGATGLFFYAGHGVQMRGENYLIPVNVRLRKQSDLDVAAVPLDLVLKQMDFAESAVNIVILDACRNNPLSKNARDVSRGLAEIKQKPIGSFISFSTAPGEVAEDGNGANSPYTAALAETILRPGLDLAEVFRAVRKSVIKATNQKQVPWDSWSLTDPYYFIPPREGASALEGPSEPVNPPTGPTQQMALMDPKQIELAFWSSIMNSNNPADYEAYLEQYPAGSFAVLAKNRLKALSLKETTESDRTVAPAAGVTFTAVDQVVYTRNAGALYTAPDEKAAVISTTPPQTAIRAAGRSPDGGWWQLHLPNGRTAYAKAADITEQDTAILSADAGEPAEAAPAAEPDLPNFAAAPSPPAEDSAAAEPPADLPNFSASPAPSPTAGQDVQVATAPSFGLPPDAQAKQHFETGEALFAQGDLYDARASFDAAIAAGPQYAEAYLRRGQVALAMDNVQSASADLGMAILYAPANLEARSALVLARLAAGDAAAAAKAADEMQQVDATVWSIDAVAAYYLADRLDDALAMAERVTGHQPDYAMGWIWQSLVMQAQGRDGEALDRLEAGMGAVGNRDWPVPIMEWMLGKRKTNRLIEAAKNGGDKKIALRQLSEMAFFVGEALLREGDRQQAEAMLWQSSETKMPDLLACAAARALLVKMEQK